MFKRSFIGTIITSLFFVVIFTGFSHAQQSNINLNDYDGKTIYRGLAFGQGPVSELFPEMWTKQLRESNATEESMEAVDQIMNEMEKVEPKIFNEFEQAIKSGDHKKIYSAIIDASGIFEEAIKKSGLELINPNNPDSIVVMAGVFVGIVLVAGVYIFNTVNAVNIVAAGNVAAAKNKVVGPSSNDKTISGDTQLEMFVEKITDVLNANQQTQN